MAMKIKTKIINSIIKVHEEAPDCEMKPEFLKTIHDELRILSSYFQTTKNQALFVAIVFGMNYRGNTVDLNDIGRFLYRNPIRVPEYNAVVGLDEIHNKVTPM